MKISSKTDQILKWATSTFEDLRRVKVHLQRDEVNSDSDKVFDAKYALGELDGILHVLDSLSEIQRNSIEKMPPRQGEMVANEFTQTLYKYMSSELLKRVEETIEMVERTKLGHPDTDESLADEVEVYKAFEEKMNTLRTRIDGNDSQRLKQ